MEKAFNNINAPLKKVKSFEKKINAIIEYLYIGTVYCRVDKKINRPITSTKPKFNVTSISIKSGTPEYLTNYLNTSWQYLEQSLDKELEEDKGFFNTRKMLNKCKGEIFREIEKYNPLDNYTFEAIHSYCILTENGLYPALYENLCFKPKHWATLRTHCNVRSSFLTRLLHFVDSRLNSLVNVPNINSTPFQWNSKKEIEITELLYALKLSGRILINEGNDVQLREKFFNFFGLHDRDYNKRTKDIRRRQTKAVFLRELIAAIENAT